MREEQVRSLALLAERVRVCERLAALVSPRSAQPGVEEGDNPWLADDVAGAATVVRAQREGLYGQLRALDAGLAGFRETWESRREALPPAVRAEAARLVDRAHLLLNAVVASERGAREEAAAQGAPARRQAEARRGALPGAAGGALAGVPAGEGAASGTGAASEGAMGGASTAVRAGAGSALLARRDGTSGGAGAGSALLARRDAAGRVETGSFRGAFIRAVDSSKPRSGVLRAATGRAARAYGRGRGGATSAPLLVDDEA